MGELDFGRRGCSYLKMNSIILILTLVGTVVLATSDRKMDNFAFEKLMDALETEMGQSFRDPPAAEEVTYEIGPANTNACAVGRLPLTVDECRAAAKQIGAKIKESGARKSTYWSGSRNLRTNAPRGCLYSDEGGFAFNDHHTG